MDFNEMYRIILLRVQTEYRLKSNQSLTSHTKRSLHLFAHIILISMYKFEPRRYQKVANTVRTC